jgi:uncharacterized membrane protein
MQPAQHRSKGLQYSEALFGILSHFNIVLVLTALTAYINLLT